MRNKDDELQELDESRNKWEISLDLYIIKRDRLINEIAWKVERICNFCVTPWDTWCICYWNKWYKYNY